MASSVGGAGQVICRALRVVIASSVVIATCLASIEAMGLTAWSFSRAGALEVPLVATFRGNVEPSGSPAVAVHGSWLGALAVVLILTAPPATFAIAYRGRAEGI